MPAPPPYPHHSLPTASLRPPCGLSAASLRLSCCLFAAPRGHLNFTAETFNNLSKLCIVAFFDVSECPENCNTNNMCWQQWPTYKHAHRFCCYSQRPLICTLLYRIVLLRFKNMLARWNRETISNFQQEMRAMPVKCGQCPWLLQRCIHFSYQTSQSAV